MTHTASANALLESIEFAAHFENCYKCNIKGKVLLANKHILSTTPDKRAKLIRYGAFSNQ